MTYWLVFLIFPTFSYVQGVHLGLVYTRGRCTDLKTSGGLGEGKWRGTAPPQWFISYLYFRKFHNCCSCLQLLLVIVRRNAFDDRTLKKPDWGQILCENYLSECRNVRKVEHFSQKKNAAKTNIFERKALTTLTTLPEISRDHEQSSIPLHDSVVKVAQDCHLKLLGFVLNRILMTAYP